MPVFSKTQRGLLCEVEKQYTDQCAVCGGPWHPSSGQLVGSPMQVKVCGACFVNDIVPLIKDRMGLNMRLTSRNKKDRISFYKHAASSIIGSAPKRKTKADEGVFTPTRREALREDTEDDALRRKRANDVWDRVVAFVKKHIEAGDFEDRIFPHMATGGFVLPSKVTDHPAVILAPKGAQTGFGRAKDGKPVIIVGGVLLKPFDLTYLDTRITGVRGSFVHEYTHFQDWSRYKVQGVRRDAARAAETGNLTDYFRSPEEFNAWYQETAHLAQAQVEATLRMAKENPTIGSRVAEIERKRFATFSAFMTWLGKLGRTQEALDALKGTKWERKWLRRAHGLYEMLKEMFMSATTEGVFTPTRREALRESRFNLDQIEADIMSDDPQTYGAYYPDDLHGSLKDRLVEIVYYGAYTAAAGKHDVLKARQRREALFALAKREKVLAAVEKAWRDGLKDGGA